MGFQLEIVEAGNWEALGAVRELWTEYWESTGLPAEFQNFSEELRTLPGEYGPPGGRLLLLRIDGQPAGTGAFRALGAGACEAKRLYVRPAFRRRGLAGYLLAELVQGARGCGYTNLYGDTLPAMQSALALYREIGFVEAGPYTDNPTPGAIYLRLSL